MKFERKDIVDQFAHVLTVWTILLLCGATGLVGCTLAGFAIGALAEIKEDSPRTSVVRAYNAVLNSKKDMAFYVLAGFLFGAFA